MHNTYDLCDTVKTYTETVNVLFSPQQDSLAHTNIVSGLQRIIKFPVKANPCSEMNGLTGIITGRNIFWRIPWMDEHKTSIFIILTLGIWWRRLWIMWVKPHKPEDYSFFIISELETHYVDGFAFEFLQLLNVLL